MITKFQLVAIVSTLVNCITCAGDNPIQLTVVPRLINGVYHESYGAGNLTLTGSNLSYAITIPGGPWNVWIGGPSGATQIGTCGYFFPPTVEGEPPPTTPLPCDLQGTVILSENQISELLTGLWSVEGDNRAQFGLPTFTGPILPVDSDQDGVPDYLDQCPNSPIGAVVNANGCSIDQLCPREGPWKNKGEYLKHLRSVTAVFVSDRLITKAEAQSIIRDAIHFGHP